MRASRLRRPNAAERINGCTHIGTEDKHPEGNCERRYFRQLLLVDGYEVNGVRKSRCNYHQCAGEAQCFSIAGVVHQEYATGRQQYAQHGMHGELLMAEDSHDDSDQKRIDEKDGGCDACRHIIVADEQGQRGQGHENP